MELKAYLDDLKRRMEAGWCRLPYHEKFANSRPMALPAKRISYENEKERDSRIYDSPEIAVLNALKNNSLVTMFGGPGAGKSTTTRLVAHHLASLSADEQEYLPIWVNLNDYVEQDQKADFDLIKKLDGIEVTAADGLTRLWIMDGLDIILAANKLDLTFFFKAIQKSGDRVLLASRPTEQVKGSLNRLDQSERIELEPLNDQLRAQWLEEHDASDLLTQLDQFMKTSSNAGLMNVPLLFVMQLSVWLEDEAIDTEEYSGRAGMFNGFLHYLWNRVHRPNRGDFPYEVASAYAYGALMLGDQESFNIDKTTEYFERAHQDVDLKIPDVGWDQAWKEAREKLVWAGLISNDGQGHLNILHQQFTEHLAARHLARRMRWAESKGFLEAEMWDHYRYVNLDPMVGQGIAIVINDPKRYDIAAYLNLLGANSNQEKLILCPHIGLSNTVESILIDGLKDSRTFSYALMAVSQLNAVSLEHHILENISYPDRGQLHFAAKTMIRMEMDCYKEYVERNIDNENLEKKCLAILLIGYFEIHDMKHVVIECMYDESVDIKLAAITALYSLKIKGNLEFYVNLLGDDNPQIVSASLILLAKYKAYSVVGNIVKLVSSPVRRHKQMAIRALWTLGDETHLDLLVNELDHNDLNIRRYAVIALCKISKYSARGKIMALLNESNPKLRAAAIDIIASYKEKNYGSVISRYLSDADEMVVASAIRALGEIKYDSCKDDIIDMVCNSTISNYVRSTGVKAMTAMSIKLSRNLFYEFIESMDANLILCSLVNYMEISDDLEIKIVVSYLETRNNISSIHKDVFIKYFNKQNISYNYVMNSKMCDRTKAEIISGMGWRMMDSSISAKVKNSSINRLGYFNTKGATVEIHGNVNFTNCIVNMESNLQNVTQTLSVGASSEDKQSIEDLMTQLQEALKQIPADDLEAAEKAEDLSKKVQVFAKHAKSEERDADTLGDMKKRLLKVADTLLDVAPNVVSIATKLTNFVMSII